MHTPAPMLDPEELTPAQQAMLELLREGRVTAPYAAEETGYSLQYTREALTSLAKHGHAEKIYEGLYELVDDPESGRDGA